MGNLLLFLILLVSSLAAVLAGMAVFGNSRPPDGRLNTVLDDLDEIKGAVAQLQKTIIQLERKMDKDSKDTRTELKDSLDRMEERLDKKFQELA